MSIGVEFQSELDDLMGEIELVDWIEEVTDLEKGILPNRHVKDNGHLTSTGANHTTVCTIAHVHDDSDKAAESLDNQIVPTDIDINTIPSHPPQQQICDIKTSSIDKTEEPPNLHVPQPKLQLQPSPQHPPPHSQKVHEKQSTSPAKYMYRVRKFTKRHKTEEPSNFHEPQLQNQPPPSPQPQPQRHPQKVNEKQAASPAKYRVRKLTKRRSRHSGAVDDEGTIRRPRRSSFDERTKQRTRRSSLVDDDTILPTATSKKRRIAEVAKHWRISIADAMELMANVG
jgi:hypothetical protein